MAINGPLVVDRRFLLHELNFVRLLPVDRNKDPNLRNVLLTSSEKSIVLTASDGVATVSSRVPVLQGDAPGLVAHTNCSELAKLLSCIKEDVIAFTQESHLFVIRTESGGRYQYPISQEVVQTIWAHTPKALDAPATVRAGALKQLLRAALPFATRQNKNMKHPGIFLSLEEGELKLLLAGLYSALAASRPEATYGTSLSTFIPLEYLPALANMTPLNDDLIQVAPTHFSCAPRCLTIGVASTLERPTRKEFEYDWAAGAATISLDSEGLRRAARKCRAMYKIKRYCPIKLAATGSEVLLSASDGGCDVEIHLVADSSAEVSFALCASHILNCLRHLHGTVTLYAYPDAKQPVMLASEDGDHYLLVQPLAKTVKDTECSGSKEK